MEVAFKALKDAVTTHLYCSFGFSETFVIETDASNVGIGAILLQNNHPLAYFSKKLGLNAREFSIYKGIIYSHISG